MSRIRTQWLFSLTLAAAVAVSACAHRPATKADSSDDDDAQLKPWVEVLKDTKAITGWLTFHLKRNQALYLELTPEQLDRDMGLVLHVSQGLGEIELIDGYALTDVLWVRLHRVGDTVYLIQLNPSFAATPNTPVDTSLDGNVGRSILAALPMLSENEQSKAILVDVTKFLVSDFPDLTGDIQDYYGEKDSIEVTFDEARSFVGRVQAFPANVEIDVTLTYHAPKPAKDTTAAISDYRSLPVGIRYSWFALPEAPMQRRIADDRVGTFVHTVYDFSRDRTAIPTVDYVRRWRLEKQDPGAAVSPPKQPIVFYIDRSVPQEYRRYVREGIEAWNVAFRAAGFEGAVVAKDAPDDPAWSAEDIRYSTVRWSAAHSMGFSVGPSQVDPRTGEILNGDILLWSEFIRGYLLNYQNVAGPAPGSSPGSRRLRACAAQRGAARQVALEQLVLDVVDGGIPLPEEYLGDMLRDLVMHEVGHVLGLRHNFKASSAIPYDKLHDKAYTAEHGIAASVMDYTTINIALDRSKQGHYANPRVGPYDVWAIRYAYAPVYQQPADGPFATTGTLVTDPEAERTALAKIARESTDPMHVYLTDEDSRYGAAAVDPSSTAWDVGSDSLQFARDRIALVDRVLGGLEPRVVSDGDGWWRLRNAFGYLLYARDSALRIAAQHIGGIHLHRDHKGEPGARPTFVPVTAAVQRDAMTLIANEGFAPGATPLSPELLNKLAPWWGGDLDDWKEDWSPYPRDFPIHAGVLAGHEALLDILLDPMRLTRVVDNQARMPAGQQPYPLSELMQTLTDSIFTELDAADPDIDSFRRNLQRAYVTRLIGILLGPAPEKGPAHPADARSLARFELSRTSQRIAKVLTARRARPLDTATAAHLGETRARIDRALDASLTVTPKDH